MSRRLLLIACSNRKVQTRELLPAIQRYDGVTYRVIRKAMREGYFPPNVDIKILSAEFGLIDAETRIPYYDRRMDRRRAYELKSQVLSTLQVYLEGNQDSEVYIDLGKDYLPAIEGIGGIDKIVFAKGRIGERLARLKIWLRNT